MGMIELVQHALAPLTIELSMELDDKKPAAIKCRPLLTVDYFSITTNGFASTIPILTGQRTIEELDAKDRVTMYMWFRELVKASVITIRDVVDGKEIWRVAKFQKDEKAEPFVDDSGAANITVRFIEVMNGGDITDIATHIIQRTNFSRELEASKRGRRNR